MRFCHVLLLAAIAIAAMSAPAVGQTGIYGTFTGGHQGGIKPPYPFTGTHGFWAAGGTFGLYSDFIHAGPVRLGLDARGSILNSKGHKLDSGLGGVRVDFSAPMVPIRPYLQGSVGVGSTNFGGGNVTSQGLLYQFLGGIDATVLPHIDWRAVEVGGGALRIHGTNYPVVSVSTGIVLRLR